MTHGLEGGGRLFQVDGAPTTLGAGVIMIVGVAAFVSHDTGHDLVDVLEAVIETHCGPAVAGGLGRRMRNSLQSDADARGLLMQTLRLAGFAVVAGRPVPISKDISKTYEEALNCLWGDLAPKLQKMM